MADRSRIEWTHATWNPVTGCSKVSAGCKHCYAERFAKRLRAMGVERYRNGFRVTLHDDLLDLPKRWKTPRLVFVNSMSDLFHELVPLDFIQRVFATMRDCPHHTFQILTKRSRRLRELAPQLEWSPKALQVNLEQGTVQVDLSRLYQDIDLAETLSNLTGKWIKRIHPDPNDPTKPGKVEFADGTTEDLKNPDWRLIKPLIWW